MFIHLAYSFFLGVFQTKRQIFQDVVNFNKSKEKRHLNSADNNIEYVG